MDAHIKYRIGKSSAFQIVTILFAAACVVPLLAILYYIISAGISKVDWNFITNVEKPVGEVGGGIAHALVGSMLIILGASVIAIPLGILCGIFLSENKKKQTGLLESLVGRYIAGRTLYSDRYSSLYMDSEAAGLFGHIG